MKTKPLEIPKPILILIALAVVLNLFRVFYFGSATFLYLIWNIFLAFLPFAVSSILLWCREHNKSHNAFFILGGLVWFFLFPNAPYIVTDIIHLGHNHFVPLWYDAFLLFSSIWVGILLGMYSLSHIEQLLKSKFSYRLTWTILSIVILFSSFGIYLGRFLRWNSWDILLNPQPLLHDVWVTFTQPHLYEKALSFTALFSIFIFTSYFAWKATKKEALSYSH